MKKLLSFVIAFLLSSFLFAEYKQLNLSINPSFGLLNGQIEESVTYLNNEKERTYLSRLDWDIKNIKVCNVDFNLDAFKFVNFNIDYTQAIPGICGVMEDFDWQNPWNWPNDDPNELTNFSHHDNYLNNYSKFKIAFGPNIKLPAKITLIPNVGLNSEYIKMTGIGGYYIYKISNFVEQTFDGKVITYEHRLEALLLGLKFRMETIPHSLIEFDFSVSPKRTNIEALDSHLLPKSVFNDKIYNNLDFEGKIKLAYMINPHLGISANGYIQYIPTKDGADWVSSIGSKYWRKDLTINGGANRLFWSATFGLLFKL